MTNPQSLADNIAQATGLPYIPKLLPFGDDRALFFCLSCLEATKAIACGPIYTKGKTVTLTKWTELVNSLDTSTTRFEAWISIQGLPFNFWNTLTFELITGLCELLETDQHITEL